MADQPKQRSLFAELSIELATRRSQLKSKEARQWFLNRVQQLNGTINRKDLLNDPVLSKRNIPKSGDCYMFVYDAKNKDTLPYYDRFPLVLLVGPAPGGFYGLNLHYLNPLVRAAFLDKLISLSGASMSESNRLHLTYSFLKSTKRLKQFGPCFKHYLFDHVDTRFSKVEVPDWRIAIYLPTEHFSGATREKVWADSRERYSRV